jgi:polyisoprenoid-binding protein YceI
MATTRPHIPAFVAAIGAALVAACGDAQNFSVPSATATPSASPTATPAGTTASASAWTVTDRSKATVRVREQLVGVSLPSDAVLSAIGAKGAFELAGDGTFSSSSKITFDLTTLSSDEQNRDNFVKQSTLSVRQFPTAEFVPTKTAGLIVPLPSSGTFAFNLTGNMTIRGKTKEVTFDVSATRNGSDLVVTATANPTWKFGDFGMTAPSVPFRVLSVTDEIRLSIEVVATGPKG